MRKSLSARRSSELKYARKPEQGIAILIRTPPIRAARKPRSHDRGFASWAVWPRVAPRGQLMHGHSAREARYAVCNAHRSARGARYTAYSI